MKISVTVKTKSKIESVEKCSDGSYIVRVHEPPIEGRANKKIIDLLAQFFGQPKSAVQLVSGSKSKKKIFQIG